MRASGMEPKNISGLVLSPLSGEFKISGSDTGVNYFMTANN